MRGIAAAAAAVALFACASPDDTATDHYPALGTIVEVTVRGVAPARQGEVFRTLRAGFADAERHWHAWNDGELAAYNAAVAEGRDPAPSDALAEILRRAAEVRAASGGLYEPGIGALVAAWGFHDAANSGAAPPRDAIAAWRAGTLPVRIDLGGIAKGAAVAAALRTLANLGVHDALLNAGGDVAALGDAGGRRWRVGIRNPRGVGVIAGVALTDGEVLFTSGDYERMYERDGLRFHHLLDPRTGFPARGTASVTVLHTDPVLADAAATALFVAGDAWPAVAKALNVTHVARVAEDGTLSATAAMAARLLPTASGLAPRVVDVDSTPAG